MPDDLKKLMLAYSRRGLGDWRREADADLKKTAMQCLRNRIAEQSRDVEQTVSGRHVEPQFIPMPRQGSSSFEWSFFLPRKVGGRLDALLMFMLVDRESKKSIAFRFECSAEGRHEYSHVQLTSKLSKSGLSAMHELDAQGGCLPRWLPDSYPAFPIPAQDWTEMFLAMVTAVHGYRGGVDELMRDIFKDASGTRDARHYNGILGKMLYKLN